jgi:hypothetical protein
MRIGADHSYSSTTNSRGRVASQQTNQGFAGTLASAAEASGSGIHPPELSAATYRLFAAIDLERGDTKHAALHLSRVADAREAGLPIHPSGVLSELGRWDYTEAAAALPETGRFDSLSGQGVLRFTSYRPAKGTRETGPRTPATTETSGSGPASLPGASEKADSGIDRVHDQAPRLVDRVALDRTDRREQRAALDTLLANLERVG